MLFSDDQIAKLLLSNNLIEEKRLTELLEQAKQEKMSLTDLLVEKDVISDENLGILLADTLHLPFIALTRVSIPADILQIIPEVIAKKLHAIAFAKDKDGVKVAMTDPSNQEFLQLLAKKTGEKIIPYFTTEREVQSMIRFYRKELQKSFDEMVKDQVEHASSTKQNDVSITKIVDLLIEHAHHNKTSDLHIEPEDDVTLVRFRIDGILHDVLRFPRALHEQIVSRIKVLARLRTDEHLSAQDGKIHTEVDGDDVDLRVSIVPVVGGEKVVMRMLASRARQFSLHDLGLAEKDFVKVEAGINKPHGMVLSTGPTGSGKSTSIYAMIKIVNTREVNIATIEDPVEYDIEGVNQIQVNSKTNLTFANGLRAILRQDPDVIFVGEIRDHETAGIAINAAMTGHLVFSTLHTNDAATTLPRLMDMNIEPFLVASTVNVIIGQRLVRKICQRCRFSVTKDPHEFENHLPSWIIKKRFADKKEIRIYQGKGCAVCHQTGYLGRIGIFEVLEVTENIRKLIVQKATADQITEAAIKEGMTTMLEDGMEKVAQGLTTVDEILRATKG